MKQLKLWDRRDDPQITISMDGALAGSCGKYLQENGIWPNAPFKITICYGHTVDNIPKSTIRHVTELIERGLWEGTPVFVLYFTSVIIYFAYVH